MTPQTDASATHFPADPPPEPQTVQSALNTLNGWRQASAATAIVTAALLPTDMAHTDRDSRDPPTTRSPPRTRTHTPDSSATEAAERSPTGLRRAAAAAQPPARSDCWPLLRDRVAAERPQLLAIAAALEHAHDPDPTCVALIHELLTDGCSPLYDTRVPAADLHTTQKRVRAGLQVEPHL